MTNDTLTHLRIIRTWAEVDGKMGRGIDPVCCADIVQWIDEAMYKSLQRKRDVIDAIKDGTFDYGFVK